MLNVEVLDLAQWVLVFVSGDTAQGVARGVERPNVLLVTAVDTARCATERGAEFILKSLQNKVD